MDILFQARRSSNTPCPAAAAVAEKMATKKSAYLICGMKLGREEGSVTVTPETDGWAHALKRSEVWIIFEWLFRE